MRRVSWCVCVRRLNGGKTQQLTIVTNTMTTCVQTVLCLDVRQSVPSKDLWGHQCPVGLRAGNDIAPYRCMCHWNNHRMLLPQCSITKGCNDGADAPHTGSCLRPSAWCSPWHGCTDVRLPAAPLALPCALPPPWASPSHTRPHNLPPLPAPISALRACTIVLISTPSAPSSPDCFNLPFCRSAVTPSSHQRLMRLAARAFYSGPCPPPGKDTDPASARSKIAKVRRYACRTCTALAYGGIRQHGGAPRAGSLLHRPSLGTEQHRKGDVAHERVPVRSACTAVRHPCCGVRVRQRREGAGKAGTV